MVIEQVFGIITLILNKYRRGYVRPAQILSAVTQAQLDLFRQNLTIYKQVGFIPTPIKKFVRVIEIPLDDKGTGALPGEFSQEVVFDTDDGARGVILSPEGFQDRINSSILAPDQDNPIAKIIDSKIFIQPDEFTSIHLTYFRVPVDPVYNTAVSPDGRSQEFVEAGSVDLEFGAEYSNEITRIALMYLGVAFQNDGALQLALASNDN
jgi:hypothetical protein